MVLNCHVTQEQQQLEEVEQQLRFIILLRQLFLL